MQSGSPCTPLPPALFAAAWAPSGAQALEASPNSLAAMQQQSKEGRARFRELDRAQGDLRRERKKCEDAIEASRRHHLARLRAEERLRQARRALAAAAAAGDGPVPERLRQLVLVLSQEEDDETDASPRPRPSPSPSPRPRPSSTDGQAAAEAGATSVPESLRGSIASDGTLEHPPDPQGEADKVPPLLLPLPGRLFEEQAATAGSPAATSAACAGEEPALEPLELAVQPWHPTTARSPSALAEEPAPEPLQLDVQPWHATTMRSPSALAEALALAEGQDSHYESLLSTAGPSGYDSAASRRMASWQPDSDLCQSCKGRFTFFTRRHHCRQCGSCVCTRCSPFRVYLEAPLADGRRQPVALQKGGVHRACVWCRGPP